MTRQDATDPPRLVVCPVCGVTYPDHTGGATIQHGDGPTVQDGDDYHVWTPGPLPTDPADDPVAWVKWWDPDDDG